MRARPFRFVAPTAGFMIVAAACRSGGDGVGGASTGGASSASATTSKAAGTTASTTSSDASTTSSDASSSSSGGEPVCPPILVTNGTIAECAASGPLALVSSGTTECPADSSVYWPARLFRIPVTAGDCVHMRADNAGSTGADLFGAILDPGGKSLLFDEELPCAVTNPDGYACPQGGTTIETTGDGWIFVGAWEGNGCVPTSSVPFQLSVSINGVDVMPEAVCAGDLDKIIP